MSDFIDANGTRYSNTYTGQLTGIDANGNRYQFTPAAANRVGGVAPIRLATWGDSRANTSADHVNSTATGTVLSGEKVASQLCAIRGDMHICFNGGISGDTAAAWNTDANGRATATKAVKDLLAATPDVVLMQYSINDIIAGTSASTIVGYLKALIDKITGAGIPVIFESVNTCAASSASYINGYGSAGGFGASASTKLATLQSVRSSMKSWLDAFPQYLARYVDTSSVSDASDGYAKTDKTYYDGTHMSRLGCRAAAVLINSAIQDLFPQRIGIPLKMPYPNGVNFSMLSPSSGRASNFNAAIFDSGTGSCTYATGNDANGYLYQEYNVTIATLGSSYFAVRLEIVPDWIGVSPFFTLAAADVMQGGVDYYVDNGSGGAPIVSHMYARPRIYYDDASNNFTSMLGVAQLASTDYPALVAAESGRMLAPRLAVKAAMASSNMTTSTAIQCVFSGVSTGSFRVRLSNPQWGKVA